MRKKTIKFLFENILWYFIYLLPLFFACIHWSKFGCLNFAEILSAGGFDVLSANIVYSCLSDLFGSTGIFPMFTFNGILMYMSYFISVSIIHLAVDTLLFIVRIAQSWLDGFVGGKNV